MSTSAIVEHTPIYDLLVRERGDALAASRTAAQQTQATAQQALDWSGLRGAAGRREERAFSAFGRSEDEGRARPVAP